MTTPFEDGPEREAEQGRKVERLRRLSRTPQFVCGEYHLAENHNDKKLLRILVPRNAYVDDVKIWRLN